MRILFLLPIVLLTLTGCHILFPEDPRLGEGLNVSADSVPIQTAQNSDEAEDTMHARYNIEVYSGGGIPGSPGANFRVENYRQALQAIVDRCKLGRTVLVQATDGVSLLAIMNDDLSQAQIYCIKASEQRGVRLIDWGIRG